MFIGFIGRREFVSSVGSETSRQRVLANDYNCRTEHWVFTGEVAITANEASQPTSYLTCLLGPPFDGLRCKLNGVMSNRRDLVIEASSMEASSTETIKLLAAS